MTTLLSSMQVCSVTRGVLEQAVTLGGSDFEDAVQIACAIAMDLDSIVTRDVSGFKVSPITVLDPTALKRLILEADDQPMIDDELSLD